MEIPIMFSGPSIFNPTNLCGYMSMLLLLKTGQWRGLGGEIKRG